MVGTPALELRRCLGPAVAFELGAGDEIAVFRTAIARDLPGPLVMFHAARPARPERWQAHPQASCHYAVHLRGRRTESVRAIGRSAQGLNLDATCAEQLERCLQSRAR